VASGDGFLGTRETGTAVYREGPRQRFSPFTATGGEVSYVYFRRGNSGQNMGELSAAIWDSTGTLLAYSSDCTQTIPAAGVYRYTLSSPITLTDGLTYWLGCRNGDLYGYVDYESVTGAGIQYEAVGTSGCQTPIDFSTPASEYSQTLCVWASNDPDEDGS